jgi:hypothetical protein
MCCGLRQFISFGVFGSLNVFHGETLEVVLHSSDEGQIFFLGRFPGDAVFFDLPCDYFGVCAEGTSLDHDGF